MLKKRFIKTTIKLGDETKTFISKDGRINGLVFMRQDFMIRAYVNVGASGLHTAEIKLYNLTDKTAKLLEENSTLVLLEAGWEDSYGKIFEGRISSVGRTKPTVCVSGLEKIQLNSFADTIRNESLKSFLERLADKLGLTLSIDKDVVGNITDTSFNNNAISILKELSTEFNFDFFMTETTLFIKGLGQKKSVKKITPDSGLLDIPVVTELGIDLKTFLDPFLKCGDWFDLDSNFSSFNIGNLEFIDRVRGNQFKTFGRQLNNNRYQGSYRVLEMIHAGSSHDNTWETLITGQGLYNINNLNKIKRLDI
jgi:hypothetical protein